MRPWLPPNLKRVAPEAELSSQQTGLVRWPRLPSAGAACQWACASQGQRPTVSTAGKVTVHMNTPNRTGPAPGKGPLHLSGLGQRGAQAAEKLRACSPGSLLTCEVAQTAGRVRSEEPRMVGSVGLGTGKRRQRPLPGLRPPSPASGSSRRTPAPRPWELRGCDQGASSGDRPDTRQTCLTDDPELRASSEGTKDWCPSCLAVGARSCCQGEMPGAAEAEPLGNSAPAPTPAPAL